MDDFNAIWYILFPFGTFCGHFVMLFQEKSVNPGTEAFRKVHDDVNGLHFLTGHPPSTFSFMDRCRSTVGEI
jgi:hypothetical protein